MREMLEDPDCPLRRVLGRQALVEDFDGGQLIMPERGLRIRAGKVEVYVVIATHVRD